MADEKAVRGVRLVFDRALENADIFAPARPVEEGGGGPGPDLRPIEFSDDALACAVSERLGDDWLATPDGRWWWWNGCVWQEDRLQRVYELARRECRAVASTAGDAARLARQVSSKAVIYAAVRLAATSDRHAVTFEVFDRNDWVLNTVAGIVDLRTGNISPHDRRARITKITTAAPAGDCPQFYSMLRQAFGGDAQMIDFIHCAVGYTLTGSTEMHAMFFLYGPGGTGKSLFLNIIREALGPYAVHAPMDTFTVATGERHSTDLAMLAGARMVTASETEEGRRFDEAKMKSITGGDPITAHFMRKDNFTFNPKFKVWIAGNYRPAMRSADDAMRRRINIIPMMNKPAISDPMLMEKLRNELGGILKWAIEGALLWQRQSLKPPPAVIRATDEYFEAENVVGKWVAERCQQRADAFGEMKALHRDFKSWATLSGEYPLAERRFSQRLAAMGFQKGQSTDSASRRMGHLGLELVAGEAGDLLTPVEAGGVAKRMPDAGWQTDPAEDFDR